MKSLILAILACLVAWFAAAPAEATDGFRQQVRIQRQAVVPQYYGPQVQLQVVAPQHQVRQQVVVPHHQQRQQVVVKRQRIVAGHPAARRPAVQSVIVNRHHPGVVRQRSVTKQRSSGGLFGRLRSRLRGF